MKKYKCKDCKRESDILTLGDMYQGCADCGGTSGFFEKKGKRWVSVEKDEKTDYLNKFMSGF